METTYIIFLIALIRGLAGALNKRQPAITTLTGNPREPLCATCAYALIARGYGEREKLTACTYGGSVRPLKFAVLECTLYCNRNSNPQTVRIAGFAQSAEVALELIAAQADH